MIKPRKAAVLSLWLGVFSTPQMALAHIPSESANTFYNGLLHPYFVPSHLLLIIAFGLFLGRQTLKGNQLALASFLISTLTGLIVAWFVFGNNLELILLTIAAILGLLIASSLVIGRYLCVLIASLAGLFLGLDSTHETLAGKEKLISFLGNAVGICSLLIYSVGFADYFSKKVWQKIGIRILGSWITASSLLVLAFTFSSSTLN